MYDCVNSSSVRHVGRKVIQRELAKSAKGAGLCVQSWRGRDAPWRSARLSTNQLAPRLCLDPPQEKRWPLNFGIRQHQATQTTRRLLSGAQARGFEALQALQRGKPPFLEYAYLSLQHCRRVRLALQPALFFKGRKINAGRRIPTVGAVSGAKREGDFLVAVRNFQRRVAANIMLRKMTGNIS